MRPPCVSGTRSSDSSDSSRSPSASTMSSSRTKIALPPTPRCRTITGWLPSMAKNSTSPGQYAAMPATSGSLALSTARARAATTTSTMQRFTLASCFGRVDVAQPQVVAFADVGHDRHVAAVEAQPVAEDAAAGRFQHGRVDAAGSSARCAALCGPLQSPLVDAAIVDVDAVGAGHAHASCPCP